MVKQLATTYEHMHTLYRGTTMDLRKQIHIGAEEDSQFWGAN